MNKKSRWILVAVLAAVVAVATTLVVLALRARAKKKAWYEDEPVFDYDIEEEELFDAVEEDSSEEEIKF